MKISIKAKILIIVIELFLVLSFIIGTFFIRQLNDIGEKLVGEQALSIIKTFNYQIDGDKFENLAKSQDPSDPYFIKMNKLMHKIKNDTGCAYLYAMTKKSETEYIYVVCAEEASAPGSVEDVSKYNSVFKDAMNKGTSGYTKVEADSVYGSLLSAVVPIKNSSNEVVGILACDFLAASISAKIHHVCIGISVLSSLMLMVSCIIAFFAMRSLFNQINSIRSGR